MSCHDPEVRVTTIGSMFAGIGGLELGLERAGLGPVLWQAESDANCRAWLSDHWPDATRLHDVRHITPDTPKVDLLCGGFPCQDLSAANPSGSGLAGKRSGLWYLFRRATGLLRPAWVVIENVYQPWRRWVPVVRRDLWSLGYASVPLRVRACEVGALHQRSRAFILANRHGTLQQQQGGWQDRLAEAVRTVVGRQGAPADPEGVGDGQGPVPVPEPDGPEDPRTVGGSVEGHAPDADGARELQPQGTEPEQRRRAGDCVVAAHRLQGPLIPSLECPVHAVLPIVAGRAARIRALGNAVVPPCAEAVGTIITSLQRA